MANYIASCRSNYFLVKDKQAFETWAESIPNIEIHQDAGDQFCILGNDPDGSAWNNYRLNEETGETEDCDLFAEIAAFLAVGSVAVFLEAGAEKLRYICGYAVAVAWTGEITTISLGDIYQKAAETFVGCNPITEASY